MDHEYRIEGHVNGRQVAGAGSGAIDPRTGASELEVVFSELPEGWDPRTIVLMCCERAAAMSARETAGAVSIRRASGGYMTIGRHLATVERDTWFHAEDGRIMAKARASSVTDLRDGKRFDHSRIEGGISHLRVGTNGIAEIPSFDGIMMQASPNVIVVTTRFTARLEDGSTIYGSTNYPHYLPEPVTTIPDYQILRVESVDQEFDGRRLYSKVVTCVLPLLPPFEDTVTAEAERVIART